MEIFFLIPFTEILIVIYSFGVGLFFNNIFFVKNRELNNFSEICIFGFFLTLILSQLINFISPIKEIYFWFFLLFSILNIYKNKFLLRKFSIWIVKLFCLFVILIPFKIVIKGHDDIFYHLPKINFINNHKIIFGIGNYFEAFASTSGWSYIGSFFNFFYGSEKNLYLVSLVFFVLIINTLYDYFKRTDDNNIKVFSLISITFLCIKFYRLQEFGNDFQSILLIFLIFNLYYQYIKDKNNNLFIVKKILLFSTFATLFKIHAVLINFFFIFLFLKKNKLFKQEIFRLYIFVLFSYLLTFTTSFINSGCLLYPFKNTCFNYSKVSWSTKENLNIAYLQAYNKGYERKYLNQNENRMSYDEWISDFNWFKFHITSKSFYEPLVKGIFILFLIFFILLKFINFKIEKIKEKNLFFLCLAVIVILVWLVKIPLMRASGHGYVICSLIFLFISFININEFKNVKKLYLILTFVILTPLIIINSARIYKETQKYNTRDVFFFMDDYGKNGHLSVYQNLKFVEGDQIARGNKLKIDKKYNYYIIKRSN